MAFGCTHLAMAMGICIMLDWGQLHGAVPSPNFSKSARIGLGPDPGILPSSRRAQAEPHLARGPNRPDLLVAVFQDGRFEDGASVTCGYAISTNGGLGWKRDVYPGLGSISGGAYPRSTDPVAAIDHRGVIYISALALLHDSLDSSAIVVHRSFDDGAHFSSPIEAVRSRDASELLDKNWMAVNTFTNRIREGRVVITYTRFAADTTTIEAVWSDDEGASWSRRSALTPPGTICQGSFPVFQPNGVLSVFYWNFGPRGPASGEDRIEVVHSMDGGETFGSARRVSNIIPFDYPGVRDGYFLPNAAVASLTGKMGVVWQGLDSVGPRIFYSDSLDLGENWSKPRVVSDQSGPYGVANPALAISPDGNSISIIFQDSRNHADDELRFDLYTARSSDGGIRWLPNDRLSTEPLNAKLFPKTPSGYMIGDYLGVVPAVGSNVPSVAIWIDTSEGEPNPAVFRFAPDTQETFASWRSVRFSLEEIQWGAAAAPGGDWDVDGWANVWEYLCGRDPRAGEGVPFALRSVAFSPLDGKWSAEHPALLDRPDFETRWERSFDLMRWEPIAPIAREQGSEPGSERTLWGHGHAPRTFLRLEAAAR